MSVPPSINENRPLLFGLVGFAGHGKTTVTNMLKIFKFEEYALADPLKKGCMAMFGFSEAQCFDDKLKNIVDPYWGVSPREVLQKVGTELFRNQLKTAIPNIDLGDSNILWVRNFERYYESNKTKNIVLSDVRNVDEALMIKKLGGYIIRVHNPHIKMGDAFRHHVSEQTVNKIKYECCLLNDGSLGDLFNDVVYIINAVKSMPELVSSYNDYSDDTKKTFVMSITKRPLGEVVGDMPPLNNVDERKSTLQKTKAAVEQLKKLG